MLMIIKTFMNILKLFKKEIPYIMEELLLVEWDVKILIQEIN